MKALMVIIIIVVGVLVVMGIVGQQLPTHADNVAATIASPPKPVYKTTAKALFADYDANEVATDQRIGGAVVEISGVIQSIDKDVTGDSVIQLATPNEYLPASMTLVYSQNATAATLSKGQKIVMRCVKMMRIIGTPAGSDCQIVQ